MTDVKSNGTDHKDQISEIIQSALIDLHGANGYKSIIQTMMKISGRTEKEIILNYELFVELIECIFGRVGYTKILDPIKFEIDKIGIENIQHDVKPTDGKPMRLLVADDEPHILDLYKEWLKLENRQVITAEDGQKCVELYKQEYNHHKSGNYFDVVILDQKMPKMTGLQAAMEILKINPHQRIIFASGYLEKTLLDALTKLNRAIEVIEKPFSVEALDNMINQTTILKKLEKININQEETDISKKLTVAMIILKNQNY